MEKSLIGILIGALSTIGLGVLTYMGVIWKSKGAETVANINTTADIQRVHHEAAAALRDDLRQEIARTENNHRAAVKLYKEAISERDIGAKQILEATKINTKLVSTNEKLVSNNDKLVRTIKKMVKVLREWVPQETLEEMSDFPEDL